MDRVSALLNMAADYSPEELKLLSEKILSLLNKSDDCHSNDDDQIPHCRKCDSHDIRKYGKDRKGNQRYKCRRCGATFIPSASSALAYTHLGLDCWKKYIQYLLQGLSLEKCAALCHISVRTAFVWRHKILNVLQKDQDDRALGGVIEADEMYIPISFKGNHKNSKHFSMPRKSHKRGTDSRDQIGSRACVMCAPRETVRHTARYWEEDSRPFRCCSMLLRIGSCRSLSLFPIKLLV